MFGDCYKCGGSDAKDFLEEIESRSKSNWSPNYSNRCPNCGKKLNHICINCNGTGRVSSYIPDYPIGPKYCSECGRKLYKSFTTYCSICHGSGIRKDLHICDYY